MKKRIALFIILGALAVGCISTINHYTVKGCTVDMTDETGTHIILPNGEDFVWIDGKNELRYGMEVDLHMTTKGTTEDVTDDEILRVKIHTEKLK